MESIFQRIEQLLDKFGAEYQVLRHAPVFTSAEAAAVRGTTLSSGAKALVCKADGQFLLFVLSADRQLDSRRVCKEKGWRSLRFATREEVEQLTTLAPGSIPPFGSLFLLSTLCDESLCRETTINFNAGDHAISISLPLSEYLRVEKPQIEDFSRPAETKKQETP